MKFWFPLLCLLSGLLSAQSPSDCDDFAKITSRSEQVVYVVKTIPYGEGVAVLSNSVENKEQRATLTLLDSDDRPVSSVLIRDYIYLYDMVVTEDDGFLLVGQTTLESIGTRGKVNNRSVIMRISEKGKVMWKHFYDLSQRELFTKLVSHPNPPNAAYPYYIFGWVNSSSYPSSYDHIAMLNINDEGAINFTRKFDFVTSEGARSRDVEMYDFTIDDKGDFLLAGSSNHRYTYGMLARISASGDPVSSKQWQHPGFRSRIFPVARNRYLVTTSQTPQLKNYFQVALVDGAFNVLDQLFLPGDGIKAAIAWLPGTKNRSQLTVSTNLNKMASLWLTIKKDKLTLDDAGILDLPGLPYERPTLYRDTENKRYRLFAGLNGRPGILTGIVPTEKTACYRGDKSSFPLIPGTATLAPAVLLAKELVVKEATAEPVSLPRRATEQPRELISAAPPPPPPPPPGEATNDFSLSTKISGLELYLRDGGGKGTQLVVIRKGLRGDVQFQIRNLKRDTRQLAMMPSRSYQLKERIRSFAPGKYEVKIITEKGTSTVTFSKEYGIE